MQRDSLFCGTSHTPNGDNMSSLDVLIVGLNPSTSSPDTSALHPSTGSRKRVDEWFLDMSINVAFTNVIDSYTSSNKAPTAKEIKEALPALKYKVEGHTKIIALGRVAAKALRSISVDFLEVPHPSGLNRFWNDRDQSRIMINRIRAYVAG